MKAKLLNLLKIVLPALAAIIYLALKVLVVRREVPEAACLAAVKYELLPLSVLLLLLFISGLNLIKPLKISVFIAFACGTFLYLVDIGAQYLLHGRLIWRLLFGFGKAADTFGGFIFYYLARLPGIISLLLLLLAVTYFALNFKDKRALISRGNIITFALLALFFLASLPLYESEAFELSEPRKAFNVYQVNSTTDRVSYRHFAMPKDWAPHYELKNGPLARQRNIILIFAESLSAAYSKATSGLMDFTPELDKLAAEGFLGANYFANSTASSESRFTLLSGHPRLSGLLYYDEPKFYRHSFVHFLNERGVDTALFSPAPDLEGSEHIYRLAAFKKRFLYDDPIYKNEERFVFDSISDGALFSNLARSIKSGELKKPFFAMAVTATTHSPYLVPGTKEHSLPGCIRYSDGEIGKLVNKLKEIGFFEDGVIIITGDHHAMEALTPEEEKRYPGGAARQLVPLFIYGAGVAPERSTLPLDHVSLGAFIEYLATGSYEVHEFQQDPLAKASGRLIITQHNSALDIANLFSADGESYKVRLNGDKTTFIGRQDLNETYKDYFYYFAWLRQNF